MFITRAHSTFEATEYIRSKQQLCQKPHHHRSARLVEQHAHHHVSCCRVGADQVLMNAFAAAAADLLLLLNAQFVRWPEDIRDLFGEI